MKHILLLSLGLMLFGCRLEFGRQVNEEAPISKINHDLKRIETPEAICYQSTWDGAGLWCHWKVDSEKKGNP